MYETTMYNVISYIIPAIWIGGILLILVHDIGVNAAGFVFDIDDYNTREKRWGYNILQNYWSPDCQPIDQEFWLFYGILGSMVSIVAGFLWPITAPSLLVVGVMVLLRKMVRSSKKAMQKHVQELHKESKAQ